MIFLAILGSILGIVILYLILSAVIPFFGKHKSFRNESAGIEIQVISDGIHMDLILPAQNEWMDWWSFLDAKDYGETLDQMTHLGFGWGDKGFYLEIPEWSDLTFRIAATAMLKPSPTLMHMTAYVGEAPARKYNHRLTLDTEQYQRLISHLKESFTLDNHGKVILLEGVGYTPMDNFYQSDGSYHAFFTCNSWASEALASAGIRTPVWTPSALGLHQQLKRVG